MSPTEILEAPSLWLRCPDDSSMRPFSNGSGVGDCNPVLSWDFLGDFVESQCRNTRDYATGNAQYSMARSSH